MVVVVVTGVVKVVVLDVPLPVIDADVVLDGPIVDGKEVVVDVDTGVVVDVDMEK